MIWTKTILVATLRACNIVFGLYALGKHERSFRRSVLLLMVLVMSRTGREEAPCKA